MRPRRDERVNETRAEISSAVLTVGRAVMVAVIVLIVLGQLYGTSVVATPWQTNDPTARTNDTITASPGTVQDLNVTGAAWYYDGEYGEAEVVTNASNGNTLQEGTDYEFYTNGTIKFLSSGSAGSGLDYYVEYSYYNKTRFGKLTVTFGQYGEVAFIMIGLGLIAAGGAVAFSFFGGLGGRRGGR